MNDGDSDADFQRRAARAEGLSYVERALQGLDDDLDYHHRQKWAVDHAALRDAEDAAAGEDKARAHQAVIDHYKIRYQPETSREALRQQILANAAARPAPAPPDAP